MRSIRWSKSASEPEGDAEAPPAGTPSATQAAEDLRTRAGSVWAATGVALGLLVVLIIFILQNQTRVGLTFLGFDADVPVGMAMLIAAVTGGLLVAVAAGARVLQLRRALHRRERADSAE